MQALEAFKNRLFTVFDPEVRAIGNLIKSVCTNSSGSSLSAKECDQVFVQRLANNPKALKMSFWENHFELQSLIDYPEIRGRILDFGCGSGHLDIFLARSNSYIHGIDMSRIGISIANYLRDRELDEVKARLTFSVSDVTKDLPGGELFDSAWSAHVFEHISDPSAVLAGLHNWVKPGGHLLISVPFGNAYDDPGHVNHFYSIEDLHQFLSPHIKIKRIEVNREFQVIRALCIFGANHEQP